MKTARKHNKNEIRMCSHISNRAERATDPDQNKEIKRREVPRSTYENSGGAGGKRNQVLQRSSV